MSNRSNRRPAAEIATWNVARFQARADDVGRIARDNALDLIFVSETYQGRFEDGRPIQLEDQG